MAARRLATKRRGRLYALGALVAVALVIPLGRYEPYPARVLPSTMFAQACLALPGNAVAETIRTPVRASVAVLGKPHAAAENLFPSVSRTACHYRWKVTCTRPDGVRAAIAIIAALPNHSQALARYTYTKMLLGQDSYAENDFHDLVLSHRSAYELTIQGEVLTRILDGRFVVDLQFHLCTAVGGQRAQQAVRQIVDRLKLPVMSVPAARELARS
jgi:hypothetical protein